MPASRAKTQGGGVSVLVCLCVCVCKRERERERERERCVIFCLHRTLKLDWIFLDLFFFFGLNYLPASHAEIGGGSLDPQK